MKINTLKSKDNNINIIDCFIFTFIFIFSFFVFWKMNSTQMDMVAHLYGINKNPFALTYNSFLRILVYCFGLGRTDVMIYSFPFVLSLCVSFKYLFIRYVFNDYCKIEGIHSPLNTSILMLGALLITFSGPIYTFINFSFGNYNVRCFSEAVWHNPTTVAMLPFSILLFWFSYKFLILNDKVKNGLIILLLFLLNLFTKPAYLMPFIPSFLLFYLFFKFDNDKIKIDLKIRKVLIIVIFSLFALLCFSIIYIRVFRDGGLVLNPMITARINLNDHGLDNVLNILSNTIYDITISNKYVIAISFFAILLFKIFCANAFAFFIIFRRKSFNSYQLFYAFFCFVISIVIYFVVSEAGEASHDGNFAWQIIPCETILMIVAFNSLVKYLYNHKCVLYNCLLFPLFSFSLLFCHFYCGVIYLQKIIFDKYWY